MTPQPDKMREAFEKRFDVLNDIDRKRSIERNILDEYILPQVEGKWHEWEICWQAALDFQWNGPEVDPPPRSINNCHSIDVWTETKTGKEVNFKNLQTKKWVINEEVTGWCLLPERKQV